MPRINIAHAADLKDAQKHFEEKRLKFNKLAENATALANQLFLSRKVSVKLIAEIEDYVSKLENCPECIESGAKRAVSSTKSIQEEWAQFERIGAGPKKSSSKGAAIGAGGAIAGGAAATLGPTAAMAIATTFGTAATGTAISSLAGAAATNAALAWLGGGAVAAGGAEMAGGATILALFGPIGWSLAGTALIGGLFFSSSKNKKALEKVNKRTQELDRLMTSLQWSYSQIKTLNEHTEAINSKINVKDFSKGKPSDYNSPKFPKQALFDLIDNAKLLGKMSQERVR